MSKISHGYHVYLAEVPMQIAADEAARGYHLAAPCKYIQHRSLSTRVGTKYVFSATFGCVDLENVLANDPNPMD
jgi:hypothetical protein